MKKILIVDDERPVREMVKKFLTKRGYEVIDCADAQETCRLVSEQAPAIVLLDIRLPQTDGLEVLKKIKEINKDVGVIIVSAVSEPALVEECKRLGAFDYITKPIKLDTLEESVLAKFFEFYK